MNLLWGTRLASICLLMLVCGAVKSNFVVFRLLVARSRILWSDAVHRFYQVRELIVVTLSILRASGIICSNG